MNRTSVIVFLGMAILIPSVLALVEGTADSDDGKAALHEVFSQTGCRTAWVNAFYELSSDIPLKVDEVTGRVGGIDLEGTPATISVKITLRAMYIRNGIQETTERTLNGNLRKEGNMVRLYGKEIIYGASRHEEASAGSKAERNIPADVQRMPKWRTSQIAPYLYHSVSQTGVEQPVAVLRGSAGNFTLEFLPMFCGVVHVFEGDVREFASKVIETGGATATGHGIASKEPGQSLSEVGAVVIDGRCAVKKGNVRLIP
jgi:hypothetical protein